MAKHAKQLWYSHEAISQAFHFLCIYSADKEQLKQQAVHTSGGYIGPFYVQLHYPTGFAHFNKENQCSRVSGS